MKSRVCARRALVVVIGLVLAAGHAYAARPFVTDDARVTPPHACQLETWTQLNAPGTEVWALPACNPFGWGEITAGVGILPSEDSNSPSQSVVLVQGKTLLWPLLDGQLATGAAAGGQVNTEDTPAQDLLGSAYGYVPLTLDVRRDERLLVHTNVGVRYESDDGHVHALWGLGSEWWLFERAAAIGEVYGTGDDLPFSQLGVRTWIIPDHVQLDATGGAQFGDPHVHWASIGFRFISPPLW